MKKFLFMLLLLSAPLVADENSTMITLRTNGDYDTLDISKQDPQTRKILHKIAYHQYLKHNQWAAFKASLAACAIIAAISMGGVYYATR